MKLTFENKGIIQVFGSPVTIEVSVEIGEDARETELLRGFFLNGGNCLFEFDRRTPVILAEKAEPK